MDEALLASYRQSSYLVCLDTLRWCAIHVDEPLSGALAALAGAHDWGFITAWNPHSVRRGDDANLAAQRGLLAALRDASGVLAIYAGVGVGRDGWFEPSFFALGAGADTLDPLCLAYGQNAYVLGSGAAPARLRVVGA